MRWAAPKDSLLEFFEHRFRVEIVWIFFERDAVVLHGGGSVPAVLAGFGEAVEGVR